MTVYTLSAQQVKSQVIPTALTTVETPDIMSGVYERVKSQVLPTALTTPDVRRILAEVPTATIEVGPSVGHPRNWNRLHLPDGHNYIVYGCSPTWLLECSCVTPEQSCPACRAAARRSSHRIYGAA